MKHPRSFHALRFLIPAVLGLTLVAAFAATRMSSRDAEAVGGAVLGQPSAECGVSGASITFHWTPVEGATNQWLEYSLHDNDFAEATFAVIPVAPGAITYQMQSANAHLPNFWRVMSTTSAGVVASDEGQFMPCGGPILLQGPVTCANASSSSVNFRWAPLAASGGEQWLEYDNDGNFTGTDLISVGPFIGSQQDHLRGGFNSGVSYYFRVVRLEADGTRLTSQTGYFVPDCTPQVNTELYASDDTLIAPRLGINAPVNVRDVGFDGSLGVPSGAYDVVRYNFATYAPLATRPGGAGTMLIGGHVDYYVVGLAVFAPLRNAQVGDVLEYWDGDIKYTYVVDWVRDIPFSDSLNPYLGGTGHSLLLITCNGDFNRSLYGGYNLRRLVHATLQ